ncbi:LacI family transcriptional regulator [Ktedonobacter sp. SOSP1-85]|uniref:LacI family DNA-binding transcriptional regulator n=1 Tax=Ktedonobacter sp. SOSP1-85 TaxID=2778367 RepID=UPI001915A0A4|nr:LacI family DNA-binding transcriptional regulator [Ktedonobacter sp. SOSP1-85]GHO81666.1 LacI family transcriptional regulator [Ktedonobacter sp. SOSP1-85]
MSTSLNEIAEKAGVSLATASRALNGKDGVKPETRERVLAVAKELEYSVNMAARVLATSRTETICYVVNQRRTPFEGDPFYPIIMHGVEAELSRHGYHLLLSTISEEQKSIATFKPVAENRVDGIILAGPDIPTRFILELKQEGIPMVLIDNMLLNTPLDTINSDDVQGAYKATTHLIEHGHRDIVALLGPENWASSVHRGQGYKNALVTAGLTPHLFHAEDTTLETGQVLLKETLKTLPNLTAIFAVNDAMALGALRALQQLGRRVPEDIALIGFDDTYFSALSTPPLSTVKVFTQEMGKLAARRLLNILEESEEKPVTVQTQLTTELVLRRSCGCAFSGY